MKSDDFSAQADNTYEESRCQKSPKQTSKQKVELSATEEIITTNFRKLERTTELIGFRKSLIESKGTRPYNSLTQVNRLVSPYTQLCPREGRLKWDLKASKVMSISMSTL